MLYSANPISTTTTLSDYQEIVYQDTEPMDKREYDDLKEKYDGDDFIYERTIEQSGWWTRFKKWLSDFFKDLFDFQSDAEASDAVSSFINIFFEYPLCIGCFLYRKSNNK